MADFQKPPNPALGDDRGDPHSFPPFGAAIKVLMIWPRFPPSFLGFDAMMDSFPKIPSGSRTGDYVRAGDQEKRRRTYASGESDYPQGC